MSEIVELNEKPQAEEMYMLIGWRQWADAGSVSSGLPEYLIEQTQARKIGRMRDDNFYLFQVPGTHDLVRPVVEFHDGYPVALDVQRNEFYYFGDERLGVVVFLGDEPHMNVEKYVGGLLDTAQALGVKRMVGFGGVYGEVPYDKDRMVSCVFSMPALKDELEDLAVNFSDYHGGASIGSYVCRRAADRGMEYAGFYAFVPTYDFSSIAQAANAIRVETDYTAWLGVMRRVNYLLKLGVDLDDLEEKSASLTEAIDSKVDEIDQMAPEMEVRAYLTRLSQGFNEETFNPMNEVWEEGLRKLFDKLDEDDG